MAEILSQNQIDMLLSSLTGAGGAEAAVASESEKGVLTGKKVKEYDFRSPKLFTREQLKLLYSIYENYSRIISSNITGLLQTYCLVEIVEVEEQQYYEFNNALPDSVLVGLVDFDVKDDELEENLVMMEMSKDIGFAAIDRFLGGTGTPVEVDREYTEIEISLLEHFYKSSVSLMKNVWADHLDIAPKLLKIETNSRILQGISADENVVLVVMSILINETQGKITLCIPSSTLVTMFKKKDGQRKNLRRTDQLTDAQRKAGILSQINKTDLEIKGVLGTVDVLSQDIYELDVGDVIKLNKLGNAPVEILIENMPWFKGKLGVYNKKKAIEITEVYKRGSEPTI